VETVSRILKVDGELLENFLGNLFDGASGGTGTQIHQALQTLLPACLKISAKCVFGRLARS
jgi:hypothetical protein